MASNSETGHQVNLDNGKLFIDIVATLGIDYNPSNSDLSHASLMGKWVSGTAAHQAMTALVQAADHPINERQDVFKNAGNILRRSFYYYESSGASKAAIEDARGLKVRFTGSNVRRPKDANGVALPGYISKSHQSFSQKADTFRQLKDLYAADSSYGPNEADLTMVSITSVSDRLHDLNNNMGTILAPIIAAKTQRDVELYEPIAGFVDRILAAKKYIRGLYGPSSPQYNSVKGILFKKIRP